MATATANCVGCPRLQASAPRLLERWFSEHDRRIDLAVWDGPVDLEKCGLALLRDELEAALTIEADRPVGGGPGTNEHAPRAEALQMGEQRGADAAALAAWQDVRVSDQVNVADWLDAHDPDQRA